MANIETKYDYGQPVSCYGLIGKITATHVRDGLIEYEFSYVDSNGKHLTENVAECELAETNLQPIGFKRG